MIRIITLEKADGGPASRSIEALVNKLKNYVTVMWTPVETPDIEEAAEHILRFMDDGHTILLARDGVQMSSFNFTEMIRETKEDLILIIPGAEGVSTRIHDKADTVLSMSQMTMAPAMLQIFVLDQLVQAHCLIQGHKYSLTI